MENPTIPEFESWDSFSKFSKHVRRQRRFATDGASRAFIATVLATAPKRHTLFSKDTTLYRAQAGVEEEDILDVGGNIVDIRYWGHPAARMVPDPERVTEGRANPSGIAFLYLASHIKTAISEIRPWIGSKISVADFRIARDLTLINVADGHGQVGISLLTLNQLAGKEPIDAETKRRVVWTDIDNAFSRPVSRSEDLRDYVPTQILAEAFRETGYDGIVYRSRFGDPGYNVVLFSVADAIAVRSTPYVIKDIDISFEEDGQPRTFS